MLFLVFFHHCLFLPSANYEQQEVAERSRHGFLPARARIATCVIWERRRLCLPSSTRELCWPPPACAGGLLSASSPGENAGESRIIKPRGSPHRAKEVHSRHGAAGAACWLLTLVILIAIFAKQAHHEAKGSRTSVPLACIHGDLTKMELTFPFLHWRSDGFGSSDADRDSSIFR